MNRCNNDTCQDPLEQIRTLYTDLARCPEKNFGWAKGKENARQLGYAQDWLDGLPDPVWECCAAVGNPFSVGVISTGDHVLDLGCGAGADLCVAALLSGPSGRAIGVDCTAAMTERALRNADLCNFHHVETHTTDFVTLPLPDHSIDVIISNGAINLAVDKPGVLAEACRILKPGGRFYIADMVRTGQPCESESSDEESWADCVLGTLAPDCFQQLLRDAGFSDVEMTGFTGYQTSADTEGALFRARKPAFGTPGDLST